MQPVEHRLRPPLSFFQMPTVPGAVDAQNAHFVNGRLVDETVLGNVRRLAEETVRLWRATSEGISGAAHPAIRRKPGDEARVAPRP